MFIHKRHQPPRPQENRSSGQSGCSLPVRCFRALNRPILLKRKIPLSDFVTVWRLLPKVCNKRLQDSICLLSTSFPKSNGNKSTPGRRQSLPQTRTVAKGDIEHTLLPERDTGFYSWYIIVPNKDGGLCPILDLRGLNRTIRTYKCKMVTMTLIVPQLQFEE